MCFQCPCLGLDPFLAIASFVVQNCLVLRRGNELLDGSLKDWTSPLMADGDSERMICPVHSSPGHLRLIRCIVPYFRQP